MRSILVLSLLSAALACASEATDRVSIDRLIRTLNESPQSPDLFASGFDGANDLWRITHNTAFSNSKIGSWLPAEAGSGHVTISHEPMGEATFSTVPLPRPVVVDGPPRFVVQSLRFLAPDVALLDTVQEHYDISSPPHRFPVLLVLKKEKKVWRIASLRAVAQP